MTAQPNKPFWFVWNPCRNIPTHKHDSLQSAIEEAERLARANRGQTFIVLESVTAIVVDDIQRIDLRPEFCDEIPF